MTASRALCLLTGLLLVPFSDPAAAQTKPERIEDLLGTYHAYGLFDGAALVAEGGDILFEGAFGEADRAWHVENAPDTRFRIASTTKPFTAALVLALVEDGEIDLDGRVSDYLPGYPPAQGDQVRIRHLLSHTSGIPSYTTPDFMSDAVRDPHAPEALLALFSGLPLEFEPGSRWSYSNSGFVLLGAIVEAVTGESYGQVLRERVLDPLGLDDTGVVRDGAIVERMATGYVRVPDGHERAPYLDPSVPYSAGGLYSTVRDLFALDQALYGRGPFRRAETVSLLFEPRATLPPELPEEAHLPPSYGFGWFVGDVEVADRVVRVTEHGGSIFGFSTAFMRMPEERNTIVLLANTSTEAMREIARGVLTILYGGTPPAPRPRTE